MRDRVADLANIV